MSTDNMVRKCRFILCILISNTTNPKYLKSLTKDPIHRAIITKYQHLRDYVEKVQYPLPCMELLEYELATSYTGECNQFSRFASHKRSVYVF